MRRYSDSREKAERIGFKRSEKTDWDWERGKKTNATVERGEKLEAGRWEERNGRTV